MNLDEIVERFVKTINKHDAEAVCQLITEDHVFIDSGGEKYQGLETMKEGWAAYFKMMPDYKIDIADIFEQATQAISRQFLIIGNQYFHR